MANTCWKLFSANDPLWIFIIHAVKILLKVFCFRFIAQRLHSFISKRPVKNQPNSWTSTRILRNLPPNLPQHALQPKTSFLHLWMLLLHHRRKKDLLNRYHCCRPSRTGLSFPRNRVRRSGSPLLLLRWNLLIVHTSLRPPLLLTIFRLWSLKLLLSRKSEEPKTVATRKIAAKEGKLAHPPRNTTLPKYQKQGLPTVNAAGSRKQPATGGKVALFQPDVPIPKKSPEPAASTSAPFKPPRPSLKDEPVEPVDIPRPSWKVRLIHNWL